VERGPEPKKTGDSKLKGDLWGVKRYVQVGIKKKSNAAQKQTLKKGGKGTLKRERRSTKGERAEDGKKLV